MPYTESVAIQKSLADLSKLVLVRVAFYSFLALSLLSFPEWMPWLIGTWLVLFAIRRRLEKTGWPILAFCLGVLVVKRVDWSPARVFLGIILIIEALRERFTAKWSKLGGTRLRAASLALIGLAWMIHTVTWPIAVHTTRRPRVEPNRPIVCLGDSLTSFGYPRVLADRLRVPLIDGSAGGITARQGLDKLPELLAQRPQTVVIELGGHDYVQGRGRKQTKETLVEMISMCRVAGAEVLLFEIPRGFITDPYAGLEREIGREYDLEIIPDGAIRKVVLFSPFTPLGKWGGHNLSDDGLHPNAQGNVFLAAEVEKALRRVHGSDMFR